MIAIISGPSCSGKSTFIETGGASRFFEIPDLTSTIFAMDFRPGQLRLDRSYLFHYNLLRPFSKQNSAEGLNISTLQSLFSSPYRKDKAWADLITLSAPKKVAILVANRDTLIARASQREYVEQGLWDKEPQKYQRDHWVNLMRQIDLFKVYKLWIKELSRSGIEYFLIDSTTEDFKLISTEEQLKNIVKR